MASYVKPMVMVYQEYAATSNSTITADLPACIVGPCYHVIDSVEDAAQAYAGRFEHPIMEAGASLFDTAGTKKSWLTVPSLITGAIVDTESCNVNLTGVRVRYATYVPVTVSAENRSVVALPNDNANDEIYNISEESSDGSKSSAYVLPSAAKTGDSVMLYYRPVYSVPVAGDQVLPEGEEGQEAQAVTYSYGEWAELCSRTIRSAADARNGTLTLNASVVDTSKIEQALAADVAALPGADYSYAGIELSICVYRNLDSLAISLDSLDEDGNTPDGFARVTGFSASDETFKFSGIYYKITTGVSYKGDDDVKTYHGALCLVSEANVYFGYRALRQDLTTGTVYTLAEVEGRLGKVVPENPLAFGMSIAVANSSGQGIIFAAVPSDDLAGYTTAKDRISNMNPCYGIVPLTQNVSVLTMFKQHAVAMSEPTSGMWRIAIGSTPLATQKEVYKGVCSVNTDTFMLTAYEDEAYDVPAFISNGIVPGDELRFSVAGDGREFVYEVKSVLSDDQLTVKQNMQYPALPEGVDSMEFVIIHDMDKTEQAQNIAAVSQSYGSRRYVNVWPDVCSIDGVEHPSYYLGCAIAAGCGALPSQYGFTKLSLAGFDGLRHSNDYFNSEQLDIIADGGTFIFVCDAEGAAPYVRHELTTDRSTIEFQELMFTKNFDYVSYVAKAAMDPFIGSWNITSATIASIRAALDAAFRSLTLDAREKIGSPILDYEIGDIVQLENTRDRVEAYVDVTFPYPLNHLGLHIMSR